MAAAARRRARRSSGMRRRPRGARRPEQTGAQSGAPRSLRASDLAPVAIRFVLACLVLGWIVVELRDPIHGLVARLTRDIAFLTSAPGLFSGLRWDAELERFVLGSGALGTSVAARSVSLPFLLVLPAAASFALPARHRIRRAIVMSGVCLVVASAILSQDILALLDRSLAERAVSVFPEWRVAFLRQWLALGWDLAMIAVPTAACVWALWPVLAPARPVTPERRPPAPTERTGSLRLGSRRLAALAGAALLALLVLDAWIDRRLGAPQLERRFLEALAERDSDLPDYFLGSGRRALASGRWRDAGLYFERAVLFEASRTQARDGLASLESAMARREARRAQEGAP